MIRNLRRTPTAHRDERPPMLSSPWSVRLTRVALWTLVAVGAVGGLAGALRSAPAVAERPAPPDVPPWTLGGVAEAAVRQWLTSADVASRTAPVHVAVDDVTAIAVAGLDHDYWAVTVLAVVRLSPSAPLADWYLQIGIATTTGGLRPVGPPAPVPAPVDLRPLDPAAAPARALTSDDPLAATASAFLQALLTGDADPVRYAAPDAGITAIAAPPFASVRVDRIGVTGADARGTHVRISVTATTAEGVEFGLTYELTLAQRAGRWEVNTLSATPTRRPTDPSSHPPPTTAPPPPSSSTTAPAAPASPPEPGA